MKKCGYSFWGYLGDVKCDRKGNIASTPDGNAFYSWCIIRELQKRGYEVTQIMPDRDEKGYELEGDHLFSSWIESERVQAYIGTKKLQYYAEIDDCRESVYRNKIISMVKDYVIHVLETNCDDMEFILHEYRMLIPGRNNDNSIRSDSWQPDYLIQECLFEYCCKNHKKLILFDLDYKLDLFAYTALKDKGCDVSVIELGERWLRYKDIDNDIKARKVFIPFDFDNIGYFDLLERRDRKQNLVYVGNRYERDWCIDKYIPDNLPDCMIYGNWLEGGRDTRKRWTNLHFGKRLQTCDMHSAYSESISTILLAKKEYCEYGFMTARIIESVFYGTVPLFITEYGEHVIKWYAGEYAEFLTVTSKEDVIRKVTELLMKSGGAWINIIIEYLREHLKFMDVKYFVDTLLDLAEVK